MKKVITIVIVNIIFSMLQVSFLPDFFGKYSVPNLVLALAFAFLLLGKLDDSLLTAFSGGILLDFVLNKQVGLSAFILCSLVYLTYLARKFVFRGPVFYFLLNSLSACLYLVIVSSGANLFDYRILLGGIFCALTSILFSMVYKRLFSDTKY